MDSIIGLVKFLIGVIVALVALVLILLVVISRMPADGGRVEQNAQLPLSIV